MEVILPPGVRSWSERPQIQEERGTLVNDTGLPDSVVGEAVLDYISENASVLGVNQGSTLSAYSSNQGGLLARSAYRPPTNVIDEICLARDLAERDDDVAPTMGLLAATAFGEGMAHVHKDPIIAAVFDEIAENCNLDEVWMELYREWLISSSINTATVFTSESFSFQPDGSDQARTRNVIAPRIGVLPAENIRVLGSDLFRTGRLALKPANGAQERFLSELFDPKTTAARVAELRAKDPVMATLCIGKVNERDPFPSSFLTEYNDPAIGQDLYLLNPRLVHRSTMAKGAWAYPRPMLTRDFSLLEAKRLLNIMDYALLQGGSNFLVVAKKGTDQKPAKQREVDNLYGMIQRAGRTGVLVGDHRLDIEIITPELTELLNPDKRRLIGRKLANAILRVPEADTDDGGEGAKARVEFISRVIQSDRRLIKRHVERGPYKEAVRRNSTIPSAPGIWFPKVILQGVQYFTDLVLKLRDRGDISRKTAVNAGGFDYDAEVQQRKREKPDDKIMTPAEVPFSSPNAGPQDNGPGRPTGTSPNNGRGRAVSGPARARPRRTIGQNAGETVTAMYREDLGTYRMGEQTAEILEEYATTAEIGRTTAAERRALTAIAEGHEEVIRDGTVTVVPVNLDMELDDVRAVRLRPGLSVLVGRDNADAQVARAYAFREPEYTELAAVETVLSLGYDVVQRAVEEEPETEAAALPAAFELHIHASDGRVMKKVLERDDEGRVVGVREVPDDADA